VIRTVAGELLSALGHDVVFAQTGEAALETYRAAQAAGNPYDVVILDLTIRGGMGEIGVPEETLSDPDVNVIISSGYSDDAALSNYRKQGFQSFLKKPYNLDELPRILSSLLAGDAQWRNKKRPDFWRQFAGANKQRLPIRLSCGMPKYAHIDLDCMQVYSSY
jgi:CheY-like chemotaxis protein